VGNPEIKPESHLIEEVGYVAKGENLNSRAAIFYDKVENYIFRDTAKGQAGVVSTSGETIYRNINSSLAGVEVEQELIFDQIKLKGNVSYTHGQNESLNIPLAQVPPLKGAFDLSYKSNSWTIGTTSRFATAQDRVDLDNTIGSGRDVRKTPNWETLDVYARYEQKYYQLNFGVRNSFNRKFSEHLNRSNAVDSTESQVNEPGQSTYLQISASL
jgi:iron complex outermembrane receptor protein